MMKCTWKIVIDHQSNCVDIPHLMTNFEKRVLFYENRGITRNEVEDKTAILEKAANLYLTNVRKCHITCSKLKYFAY